MGSSLSYYTSEQSYYTTKQKETIILSIPSHVDKMNKIFTSPELNDNQKGKMIFTMFKELFNMDMPYMRGFDEAFIAGLASGYIAYLQTLDLEDKTIFNNSIVYLCKLLNIVDSSIIQV